MRDAVCSALLSLFGRHPFVFLTGDLGFQALEPLRAVMGEKFINAGISEQNMISVAAGLAQQGMMAWTYSIGSFGYARPFEQIRNDVCLQSLPVKLVGNGGGYAYGAMGPSHHALEDYGILLTLPGMRVYVPIFGKDVQSIVERMAVSTTPGYLRLGRCECPPGYTVPPYAPWRRLLAGRGTPTLVVGPVAGSLLAACLAMELDVRPEIWGVTELPVRNSEMPAEFLAIVRQHRCLCVVEEHVAHGGVGQMVAHELLTMGVPMDALLHAHAHGYPSATCGSQSFHRRESALDAPSILRLLGLGS
ncbi:MAG: transketolase [Magnetococcales bacterium]|nr:transketolase [Magnetococcales bacterium]